jgi:Domain of unknown function (DUF6438)
MRVVPATIGAVSLVAFANLTPQSPTTRRDTRDACVASLSGFPKDTPLPSKPQYPTDMTGITLEYFASGCYGNCPAFTLTINKESAVFEGRAYVRAMGRRTAKLSSQQFETLLHPWYDGRFYAMRDDYCSASCPAGTVIVVTDIPESSITLTTPAFEKRVFECFSTRNGEPQTPKPPEQYFQFSRRLWAFARDQHWL